MPAVIRVENLVKKFPVKGGSVWAASGVNFAVDSMETLGLVGESGSGKTTVGRCLLRLIEPDRGQIFFQEVEITHLTAKEMRALRPKIQMVFQHPYRSLDPRMNIESIIMEPLRLQGTLTHWEQKKKTREIISQVRLQDEHLRLFPHQLSAGEQQRVGIARSIATDPAFVVLDEPVSSLDITIRAEILDLLKSLQQQYQFSYLYISHDLTTVEDFCHRVAVMYLSAIMEIGTVNDVFKTPRHPYTRALLSSYLFPDPFVERSTYTLAGEIPSAINLPSGCFLFTRCPEARPECRERRQVLENVPNSTTGHLAACWRVTEGDL